MSNLTVSSAVDNFLQATDQADMVAALGTLPSPLPFVVPLFTNIVASADDFGLFATDANDNLQLGAIVSEAQVDIIGFSAAGIASVTAASDSTQLPITRTVGKAVYNFSTNNLSIGSGGQAFAFPAITGYQIGDTVSVSFDFPLPPNTPSAGGVVFAGVIQDSGSLGFQFQNTDVINSYLINSGNMYVTVTR